MNKWIKYLIGLKVAVAILAAFSPFVHPHIIRQTDTMAVALRYWMRWTLETDLQYPLLPAVLTAGDSYGITPMEFPFLNLITAPFFALGADWGKTLSALFVIILYLSLTYALSRVWRGIKLFGVDAGEAIWLMLIFGVSQMYWGRFMPDYLAFSLVLLAVGLSFKEINIKASLPLAALGLLIKPPAIIAMGILLIEPKTLLKHMLWIIPAFIVCILYYTKGIDFIRSVSDHHAYFKVEFRNPIESLINFISNPIKIAKLIYKDLFTSFLIFPMGGWMLWRVFKNRSVKYKGLIGIFFLQILGIAMLNGDHSFIHDYYFVGASFSTAIIFLLFLKLAPKSLINICLLILTFYQLERGLYETRAVFGPNHWKDCARIIETGTLKDIDRIDNPKKNYPTEGLCLGKIQNSKKSNVFVDIQGSKVIIKDKKE